ncbi:insulinase family protein [Streptomyces sp. MUM 136J]|uniref:M16 family metallopeptidase n=1 Tax=Streptomyces sp. MUM 136J TaxID=2791992 RepID=UPI001F04A2F1|nr:pitrilysin family protein [Streptomyces sp. MUM 136J]MCH0571638.1 insulinase family protein [Streptomyces sp. MUM 136J]
MSAPAAPAQPAAERGVPRRLRLDNGLRVVITEDHDAPAVAVAVTYDVGFRSEPEGHSGFAHLFEHLMFEGSEHVGRGLHARLVQAAGGIFNGTTHRDHTAYYQVVPAEALERVLFLEADRMRAPRITEETLAHQIAVVGEEVRRNITGRPYGGFPWVQLPPAVFTTFANTHNGYGDLADLRASGPDDLAAFFDAYYAPGNAVLTVVGAVDADRCAKSIARHFGPLPARPVPPRARFGEPEPTADRIDVHDVPGLPLPALALGLRLPDPVGDFDGYRAATVLGALLGDGETSLLHRTVVRERRLATFVHAGAGLTGVPWEVRDPDVFVIRAMTPAEHTAEAVADAAFEALERLADKGPDPAALTRAAARLATEQYLTLDRLGSRARAHGRFELHHGDAALADRLPERLLRTTPRQIADAATALAGRHRRGVLLRPAPTHGGRG